MSTRVGGVAMAAALLVFSVVAHAEDQSGGTASRASTEAVSAPASESDPARDTLAASLADPVTILPATPPARGGFPLGFDADVTAASAYRFQGFDYSASRPVLQPEGSCALGAFTVRAWANHDLTHGWIDELDLSAQLEREVRGVTLMLGAVRLEYPHRPGWARSREALFGASAEGPLHPALDVHADIGPGHGTYATLALGGALPARARGVTAHARVFHQHHYYGLSGIPAVELALDAQLARGGFACTPALSRFVTWPNGDFRGAAAVPGSWLVAFGFARR